MEFELNDRIKEIMEDGGLTPSAFADAIGVSRPLISHILSHRNKAGVELLQKVLDHYPQVSAQWLLAGKAPKMVGEEKFTVQRAISNPKEVNSSSEKGERTEPAKGGSKKKVTRIILFFNDGSFEVSES